MHLIYVFSAAHTSSGNGVNSLMFFTDSFSTTFISLISISQQSAINEAGGWGTINVTQTDDTATEPNTYHWRARTGASYSDKQPRGTGMFRPSAMDSTLAQSCPDKQLTRVQLHESIKLKQTNNL